MRLIVSTMKDEGPFILEWVAHYLSLGFDHFIINSNDCSDGTDLILNRLAEMGIVTHIDNPGPWHGGPQAAAYENAMAHPKFAEAEWVLVCDADEFLDIKVGDHTLDALFAAAPKATAFAFIWQLFGHNNILRFEDKFVTEQFTRCAVPQQIHPMQSRAIKTLFRNNKHYRKLSTHRPKSILPRHAKQAFWVDGSGDRIAGFECQGWAFLNTGHAYGDRIARMNHYAVRSIESYMMKRMRGDVNKTSFHGKMESSGEIYWRLHCWNSVENHNLAKRSDHIRSHFDRLIADPDICKLHANAIAYHSMRILDIKNTEQFIVFATKYQSYDGDRAHLLKDNVLTDPNQAYDAQTFNITKLIGDFQFSRLKEMRTRRSVRKWPWFAGMDAFETPEAHLPTDAMPPLPRELLDGIENAIAARATITPHPPVTRRFLAEASAPKCKDWLLIGGRDWNLIDDILARQEVATLIVVDPWGYRGAMIATDAVQVDAVRLALDHAFFQTVAIYAEQIKQGRLRIVRSTPASALKLFEDQSFDVVFIAGTKPTERAVRLMERAVKKLKTNGRILFNGYGARRKTGRNMMEAIHRFIAADPGRRRPMTTNRHLISVELLPKISMRSKLT